DASALWLAAAEAVSEPAYEADARLLPVVGHPNIDAPELEPDPELPEIGQPWVYDLAAEKFLAKYAGILATVHEAAALGGEARYPAEFEKGIAMSLDAQIHLRAVARLLALEREVYLRRGDAHGAVGSIRAIFALARSLKREPILLAELLRVVFDGQACEGLQRLLLKVEASDDDLLAIDHDLAALEYHRQVHSAMLGERVLGLRSFDDPDLLDLIGDDVPNVLVWRLFRPADRSVFLQCMRELVAASDASDYASLRAAVDRAQRDISAVVEAPSARWRYPMSKMLLPSLDSMAGAVGRGTARREVARTAIAVERFRRAKGRVPAGLEELVPDFIPHMPSDPFTGGPLHWTVTEDEYRIYSVGANGIDEGGAVEEAGDEGDIFFRGRQR
ncbi:MAG: hypothetical protein ACREHD_20695, partial [Pirellulales bacterium]